MGYSNATMKNACIVVAFLSGRPGGADAATIRSECVFSRHVCERSLVALLTCGAVRRKAVKPPKARGARSRYLYYAACYDPIDQPETIAEAVAADCACDAEDEDEDDDDRFGGSDSEFPSYQPDDEEEFGGEPDAENVGNFGEIIPSENAEIISPSLSININTQEIEINKRARRKRVAKNKKYLNTQAVGKRKMNALVASVDLDDPEARRLRRKIACIVWDRNTRAELLDRAVAAVRLGFIRLCELINRARESVDAAKKAGCDVWRKFTLIVKGAFDKAGYVWEPTRPGAEPSPFLGRFVSLELNEEESEPRVIRNANGSNIIVLG